MVAGARRQTHTTCGAPTSSSCRSKRPPTSMASKMCAQQSPLSWQPHGGLPTPTACGSQSAEAEHRAGLRTALLSDVPSSKGPSSRTRQLLHAKPEAFFPAFARAVIGRQPEKAGHERCLVDRTGLEDRMLRNGEQLALVGRSSAMHLYATQKDLQRASREHAATYIDLHNHAPVSVALVCWRASRKSRGVPVYEQVPDAQLHMWILRVS